MKKYLFFALTLAALSCTREVSRDEPVVPQKPVTLSAELPETRTALGEPEGSAYPNRWSEGDEISVNGVVSQPLGSEYAGAAKAKFELSGVQAPYKAVYPASAVSGYSAGAATVTIPPQQSWRSGSYDPSAFVMLGSSESETISFTPAVTLFKIIPNASPEVKIASVKLQALGEGIKLSGAFSTDFSGITASEQALDYVCVVSPEGIPAGEPVILAMAQQT